jgi:hypothetical protein
MGQSVATFTEMFRLYGFEPCDDSSQEHGFEKIALFTRDKLVKHAARQLQTGRWTSKLGDGFDIAHSTLEDLEGKKYGFAEHFYRRKRENSR